MSVAIAVPASEVQKRLLELVSDLENSKANNRKKTLDNVIECLRDDGSRFLSALTFNSRDLLSNPTSPHVDWSSLLSVALKAVQTDKSRSRTSNNATELWRNVHYLFDQSEKRGHHLNSELVEGIIGELMSTLKIDAVDGSSSSSRAGVAAAEKDSLKIQGAISPLSDIMTVIFSYAPYAQVVKQENYEDLYSLFSDTLVTLSQLNPHELQSTPTALLTSVRSMSKFPDSFLGLYKAPVAAVNMLVHLLLQYPYQSSGSNADACMRSTERFLEKRVFPFYLGFFRLRLADPLLTRLMHALNMVLEREVAMSYLHCYRSFSHRFMSALMNAWPKLKSATLKNELVKFAHLALRVAKKLPTNAPLRIVEEMDTSYPFYRSLYKELDNDELFTQVILPEHLDHLHLDSATHSFLTLVAHVFYEVMQNPEPVQRAEDEEKLHESVEDDSNAAAASSSSSVHENARKKRRLEAEAAFSIRSIWEHFFHHQHASSTNTSRVAVNASSQIPSQRAVSWMKFLFVFLDLYPSYFQLPSQGVLLSNLIQGCLRASERKNAEVKLWGLACLSRIASVCHINGIQLTGTDSSSSPLVLSYPAHDQIEVWHQIKDLALQFSRVFEVLLKKHLFDERKQISRLALSLLTKMSLYDLMPASQSGHLQTVFYELPAMKLQSNVSTLGGKLSNQIMLKAEAGSPLQSKFNSTVLPAASSLAVKLGVKIENMSNAPPPPSSAAASLLLHSEVDLVSLRFLVAYLQRFELASASSSASATPISASTPLAAKSPATALSMRASLQQQQQDVLNEEDFLRWVLAYKFGSSLFSPSSHSIKELWSITQWFATAVVAINRLPLLSQLEQESTSVSPATVPAAVCVEDALCSEVKLPSPNSRFVLTQQPQHSWLQADLGGVNIHSANELQDFFTQAQFAPLVALETKEANVRLQELPSVCCKQHQQPTSNPAAVAASSTQSLFVLPSNASSRATPVRFLTLTLISEQLQSLERRLNERTSGFSRSKSGLSSRTSNTIDLMELDENDEESSMFHQADASGAASSSDSAGQTTMKPEEAQFGIRFFLHYAYILARLLQQERVCQSMEERSNSTRLPPSETGGIVMNLLSVCFEKTAALLPQLSYHASSTATFNLFAYMRHLLQHFKPIFITMNNKPIACGVEVHVDRVEQRCEVALKKSMETLQAAVWKFLVQLLHDSNFTSSGVAANKRRLAFDGGDNQMNGSAAAAASATSTGSLDPQSVFQGLFDHVITVTQTLLQWHIKAPVNLLNDLKTHLNDHMGLHRTVNDRSEFYRLAHLHSLAHSIAGTPRCNQDLMYYLKYLSQEFSSSSALVPPPLWLANKDLIQFRALGLFRELAASIRGGFIHFQSAAAIAHAGDDEAAAAAVVMASSDGDLEKLKRIFDDIFKSMKNLELNRVNRALKASCAYVAFSVQLTSDWALILHLTSDLTRSTDFVVRLFAATQVRTVLAVTPQMAYQSFEKKILSAIREDKQATNGSALSTSASSAILPSSDETDRRESSLMTLLACLAQMGLSQHERERGILLHMCELWKSRRAARPIIALVYQQLSDCLGYGSNAHASLASSMQLRTRSSSLFPTSAPLSLLDDHLDYILNKWFEQKLELSDFPRELLMKPANAFTSSPVVAASSNQLIALSAISLDEFLRQYQGRILAALILYLQNGLDSTLTQLQDAVRCDLPTLLKKHFPIVCAHFYALYALDKGTEQEDLVLKTTNTILAFLKSKMTEKRFDTYYHQKSTETLCVLADLVTMNAALPYILSYGVSNFRLNVQQLAKTNNQDIPTHLCAPQYGRIQQLLLHLRVRLASEFRPFRQLRLVEVITVVLTDFIGPYLCVPAVWRPIMDLLLWMLPEFDARFPSIAQSCLVLLSDLSLKLIEQVNNPSPVVTAAVNTESQRRSKAGSAAVDPFTLPGLAVPASMPTAELMLHLRTVITAMIEYSQVAATNTAQYSFNVTSIDDLSPTSATSKIMIVNERIVKIIKAVPDILKPQLSLLPPFPDHPLLTEANTMLQGLYGPKAKNLPEEILSFLINVRSSSTAKEAAAGLPHLLTVLRSNQADLSKMLQPIPPSLSSLGMDLLSTHPSSAAIIGTGVSAAATMRKFAAAASAIKNPIITVDGRNPTLASEIIDISDITSSIRVSNRILSSPYHDTSGHWAFDLVAPLIGTLCAFCSSSQIEAMGTSNVRASNCDWAHPHSIRMLAMECLGEIGAVDPNALNGHNSRVFRNANPLPPIASLQSMNALTVAGSIHPFASALLSTSGSATASTASSIAQLQSSWYGGWYAIGGGLQHSACRSVEYRSEPQSFFNHPHHTLILQLLANYLRSPNVYVAQATYQTLMNLVWTNEASSSTAASASVPNETAVSANGPKSSHVVIMEAFKQLDALTRAYLYTILASKYKHAFYAIAKPRIRIELESDAFAFSSGDSADDWICKLTRFLLGKRVKDPVLIHCGGLSSHLPEFAARLFPFILFHILLESEQDVMKMIALRFNSILSSILVAPTPPSAASNAVGNKQASIASLSRDALSVLKIILSSLQYVREQSLILDRQPMIASNSSSSRYQADVNARAYMKELRAIQQHFERELDLIKLAEAAQACDMYATSLIYLEQWHCRTYGKMNTTSPADEARFKEELVKRSQSRSVSHTHSSSTYSEMTDFDHHVSSNSGNSSSMQPIVSADESEHYHRLLIDAYSHVSDKDGIYGAMHSRDVHEEESEQLSSELILAQHQGRFDSSMQIFDSIFRRNRRMEQKAGASNVPVSSPNAMFMSSPMNPALLHASPSFSSLDVKNLTPTAAHAGLVRSLQELGCAHLVDRYMHDLSTTDPYSYASISDAHYEAAWRTTNWDLQANTSLSSSAYAASSTSNGLQAHLYQSLRSLNNFAGHHHASSAPFHSSLSLARSKLVQELSAAGPEACLRVFPSIAQLQLLADVQHSWNILASNIDRKSEEMDTSEDSSGAREGLVRSLQEFEQRGRDRLLLLFNDFDLIEPILALRSVILQISNTPSVLASNLRFVAAFARQSNRKVVGANAIRDGSADPSIPLLHKLALRLEEAQLNWSQGSIDSAIRSAKHVVHALQTLQPLAVASIVQSVPSALQSGSAASAAVASVNNESRGKLVEQLKLYVESSCLAAEWMSKSHSEASSEIERYLNHATDLISKCDLDATMSAPLNLRCYYHLAQLMDRVFQSLYLKSQSPEHEAARAVFHSTEEKMRKLAVTFEDPEVQRIIHTKDLTDPRLQQTRQMYIERKQYLNRLRNEVEYDAKNNQLFDMALANALEKSMLNYFKCLTFGDKYDTQIVYRLIALWFNHYVYAPHTAEKKFIMGHLDKIPSRKFVPLVYQIASRLSLSDTAGISQEQKQFRTNVHDLIKRMVLDHPHHVLIQVFALANAENVERVSLSVKGAAEMNQSRIKAASDLIAELKMEPSVRDIVIAEEKYVSQLIQLGMGKKKARYILELKDTPLAALRSRDLSLLHVPTVTLPVRADCRYIPATISGSSASAISDASIVSIVKFDAQILPTANGINAPYVLEMLCSDGRKQKQLLKTEDDLRQDAVMEQVFKLVNEQLAVEREAAERQLQIRTYNVVPLTPGIGLVEFVQNTVSFADCLTSSETGVHTRYRPANRKRSYNENLQLLKDAHMNRSATKDEYRKVFMEIVEDFQPLFHRFFLEAFPAPAEWLARRTAYTRSVAVNSIVGFVVGLGDRHIHNILLDVTTAEIIHIDLGVAFDMGVLLKVPEIVPFRLTRDMVDAMGVQGYEGSFRKSAEVSLKLLRENKEMLLTVLEVFLVDPLYKWALSPNKMQQLRPPDSDQVEVGEDGGADVAMNDSNQPDGGAEQNGSRTNSGAVRAMFNVRQRLSGAQHKDVLSVEGQVNALIHDATDMNKLAKMYYGWGAFV